MSLKKHVAWLLALLLISCSISTVDASKNTPTQSLSATAETTNGPTITPSPTEPPLAARVNGEGIWMDEFRASLTQYQAAQEQLGTRYTEQAAKQIVLDDLVGQTLLAQAASAAGHVIDEATLQSHIDALATEMGGMEALNSWMTTNGYSEPVFRHALQRSLAATWQSEQIISAVPRSANQVHARQILVLDEGLANQIFRQLESGVVFETLAYAYDPLTGGDLGWFPRGYLTQPAIEEAAFALQAGQYSEVIHTDFGYQIVYVSEIDDVHPLSEDALNQFQHQALSQWIADRITTSTIESYLP